MTSQGNINVVRHLKPGTRIGWKEEENPSRVVNHAELKKNDYTISPGYHILTSDTKTYRPINLIVEELTVIENETNETDSALQHILNQLGVGR